MPILPLGIMEISSFNIDQKSKSTQFKLDKLHELTKTTVSAPEPTAEKIVTEIDYFQKSDISAKTTYKKVGKNENKLPEIDETLSPKEQVAKFLLEYLFGLNIEINFIKENQKSSDNRNQKQVNEQVSIQKIQLQEHLEEETINFNAQGSVETKDGQLLQFDLSLTMKREFYSLNIDSSTNSNTKDPLIFNLRTEEIGLTTQKYEFDIDVDGTKDKISFANPGSGILVIDWNKNSKIDDGYEVVGAISGNAIEELRAKDLDNNNWIDEADDIYSELKLWEKTITGKDLLHSIKEENIGAIYLNALSTPFLLTNTDNSQKGEILNTGIYLTEDGKANNYHQINLNT